MIFNEHTMQRNLFKENTKCTMNTKCGTITHSKAPTTHFLGLHVNSKSITNSKNIFLKKLLKSSGRNAPPLQGGQTVISVTWRAGFPVNFTNKKRT